MRRHCALTAPSRAAIKRRRRGTGALEARIGYRFNDAALLERALTHISALTGTQPRRQLSAARVPGRSRARPRRSPTCCFAPFPKADEGELSRRLADLVRKETCADVARAIDLGSAIKLGASEANAGGRGAPAILADVCEALIGAVFLDGGYPAAAALIERLWGERMRTPARPLRDPKTVLQEWAQARGLPTPAYREVERTGPAPRSGIPRRRGAAGPRAGRRARPLQARRRAGRRRRHARRARACDADRLDG